MMITVQMNKQTEFNKLWKWTKTYMYNTNGNQAGLFAWRLSTSGSKLDENSAPDAEIYFITSLFFAAHRWGNGQGIFNYEQEAQNILDAVLSNNGGARAYTFNQQNYQVVKTPINSDPATFTLPSYHLPSFYKLWALWDNDNNAFWNNAAAASRAFFQNAAHPTTALTP